MNQNMQLHTRRCHSLLTLMITSLLLQQSVIVAQELVPDVTFVAGTETPYALIFTLFPLTTDRSICQGEFDVIYQKLYPTYASGILVETDITLETLTNLDSTLVTDPTIQTIDQILDGTIADTTIVTTDADGDGDVTTIQVDVSSTTSTTEDSTGGGARRSLLRKFVSRRKLQRICLLVYCRRSNQYLMDILECEEFCGLPPDRRLELESTMIDEDEEEEMDMLQEEVKVEEEDRDLQITTTRRRRRGGKYRPLIGRGAETAKLFYDYVDEYAVTDQCKTMLNGMVYEVLDLSIAE